MAKFQIYSHYKLPISKDPLKYGKLMDQINNKYIVQLTTTNVAIIEQFEKENYPLFIDDAIIINKESDSLLISQFIMENLDKKGYFISDWLFKDYSINTMDPIILLVTVPIKVNI